MPKLAPAPWLLERNVQLARSALKAGLIVTLHKGHKRFVVCDNQLYVVATDLSSGRDVLSPLESFSATDWMLFFGDGAWHAYPPGQHITHLMTIDQRRHPDPIGNRHG